MVERISFCALKDWESCLMKRVWKMAVLCEWHLQILTYIHSPNHSCLKAFWRLIGWLMGQNQHMRAAGSPSADPWASAPRISTAAASHLQQLVCCSVPYMTSALPTEDENSPHWARCYNTSLSLTDECS